MRIVFMGTPEFALPSLDALVAAGYEVVLAVTQQDKPQDRGRAVKAPPVKERALALGIPVLQPLRLSRQPDMVEEIRACAPDLLVTCAFGQLLPQSLLDIPPLGTINVHGSLLPLLRGAAPIQRAVIEGHAVTGVTTMMTEIGMDTGDMLVKAEIPISPDMTAGELHDRMAVVGAETLLETLRRLEAGTLERVPQEHALATTAPRITKDTGHVDWTCAAEKIHCLVRGTDPWPGAWAMIGAERMRICRTDRELLVAAADGVPGTVLRADDQGLLVKCGDGAIMITELQMPSSKRMKTGDYLRGHRIEAGTVLT